MESNKCKSGPPDEESRRELERIEKLLIQGPTHTTFNWLIVVGGLLAIWFGLTYWLSVDKAEAFDLLYPTLGSFVVLCVIIPFVITIAFGFLVQRARRIREGHSVKSSAKMYDLRIVFAAAIVFHLISRFGRVLLHEDEILTIFWMMALASVVLFGWAFIKSMLLTISAPQGQRLNAQVILLAVTSLLSVALTLLQLRKWIQ